MTEKPPIRAETPGSPSVLDSALRQLHLQGALFFRSEFTESWAYESPPASDMTQMLLPGADRLIMFHIVAQGRCWVSLGDGERYWAHAGDVVVLPYGDQHRVGGAQDAELVPIVGLLEELSWDTLPTLRHGQGGERTDIVCGYLHSEGVFFDPSLGALPPVMVVRLPDGPATRWVHASIDYALAASEGTQPEAPLSPQSATRLPELLLIEVLRHHLATTPAADSGWIAALHDPALAPALAALHARPAHRWTVNELAAHAAVSRSVLDERFRTMLGRSPIRYLTEWRMHVAQHLLATTTLGVGAIAHRAGYDAEESFGRAFKRHTGQSPGAWRAAHD